MFEELKKIAGSPVPFEHYTTPEFWNDPHISGYLLEAHLNPNTDAASYRAEVREQAVEWISDHFGIAGKRICDFGCGPGLYTAGFAEKGAAVTGIDISERSIKYAKKTASEKNLEINYILENYLHFSTESRFDLITMISRDFPVLSPIQRKTLLRTFHAILSDDGAVLFDIDSLNFFTEAAEKAFWEFFPGGGFWSSKPHHLFTNSFKYDQEKLLLEKYTIIEKDKVRNVYNWHQCYSMASLNTLLQENGFRITEYYSTITGRAFEEESDGITVVARKQSS